MADKPAHSLAEKSTAAAERRGADGFSPNSAADFAEGILRRRPGSYAACVHPIQAMPAALLAPAGSRPRAERR
jgi:hypothetical protein